MSFMKGKWYWKSIYQRQNAPQAREILGFSGITRGKTEDSGFDLPGTTNWPLLVFWRFELEGGQLVTIVLILREGYRILVIK